VFARTSDNTIAIFMPFENIKTARVALRRINRRVSQTVLFTNNEPFTMTLSAGVYQLELDEEIDSAILRTHQALKTAQTEGGDQISEIELAASQIGSS
jgi:GGDEF domain-containing protein